MVIVNAGQRLKLTLTFTSKSFEGQDRDFMFFFFCSITKVIHKVEIYLSLCLTTTFYVACWQQRRQGQGLLSFILFKERSELTVVNIIKILARLHPIKWYYLLVNVQVCYVLKYFPSILNNREEKLLYL